MPAESIKLKYPIVVVNADRTERKVYMTHPYLEEAIDKANKFGCHGSMILHDEDGSEICDDEILEYYLQRKAKFMICNNCNDWIVQNDPKISVQQKTDAVTQTQSPRVMRKQSSDARNPNLNRKKEIASPERTSFTFNSDVTSIDDLDGSRIFKNGEEREAVYPEFFYFAIPWDKVPKYILELMETGEPLHRSANVLANFLIDELSLQKSTLPIPIMRRVAENVVSRYPRSFSAHGAYKNSSELSEAFLNLLKNRYFNIMRGRVKTNTRIKKTVRPKVISSTDDNIDLFAPPNYDPGINVKIEYDSMSSFE